MLPNTLTLTVNSEAKVLTRVNQDNFGSVYRLLSSTERYILKIRNSSQVSGGTPFDAHNVLIEHVVFQTVTSLQKKMTASVTLRAQQGTDPDALVHLSNALGVLVAANAAAIAQGDS